MNADENDDESEDEEFDFHGAVCAAIQGNAAGTEGAHGATATAT